MPVQRGPPSAAQLARNATRARLIAEGDAAQRFYFERLALSSYKAPTEPLAVLARQHATFLQREVEVSDCSCLNLMRRTRLLQVQSKAAVWCRCRSSRPLVQLESVWAFMCMWAWHAGSKPGPARDGCCGAAAAHRGH